MAATEPQPGDLAQGDLELARSIIEKQRERVRHYYEEIRVPLSEEEKRRLQNKAEKQMHAYLTAFLLLLITATIATAGYAVKDHTDEIINIYEEYAAICHQLVCIASFAAFSIPVALELINKITKATLSALRDNNDEE